jgi:hypothetical protein
MENEERHAELLARYDEAKQIAESTRALNRAAENTRHALALALMEIEGRGATPPADWIRAHLANEHGEAGRIAAEHRDYWDDEPHRVLPPPPSPTLPLLVACSGCGGQHLTPSCLLKADAEMDCQF